MKDNLANRLAAGGFWSLCVAQLSADITKRLNDEGVEVPIGSGCPEELFVICGIGAFQFICNQNLEHGDKMMVNMRPAEPGRAKLYDKSGRRITLEQWAFLQEDEEYKRINLWTDGRMYVSTIWTGVDPQGASPPRIFETMVIDSEQFPPSIKYMSRTPTEETARTAHRVVVLAIQEGRI